MSLDVAFLRGSIRPNWIPRGLRMADLLCPHPFPVLCVGLHQSCWSTQCQKGLAWGWTGYAVGMCPSQHTGKSWYQVILGQWAHLTAVQEQTAVRIICAFSKLFSLHTLGTVSMCAQDLGRWLGFPKQMVYPNSVAVSSVIFPHGLRLANLRSYFFSWCNWLLAGAATDSSAAIRQICCLKPCSLSFWPLTVVKSVGIQI